MIIKQERLCQNKVNYSLVSTCNRKWLILGEKEFHRVTYSTDLKLS